MSDIDTISPPTQIETYLWLCDFYNLYDRSFLPEAGINAVLSLLDDPAPLFKRPEFTSYIPPNRHLFIKCSDTKHEDLLSRFEGLCGWIEKMRQPYGENDNEGIVLVHCEEGVSRSPSVLIAYLVWRDRVGVEEALAKLKGKRGIVEPRKEFLAQLVAWEEICRSKHARLEAE